MKAWTTSSDSTMSSEHSMRVWIGNSRSPAGGGYSIWLKKENVKTGVDMFGNLAFDGEDLFLEDHVGRRVFSRLGLSIRPGAEPVCVDVKFTRQANGTAIWIARDRFMTDLEATDEKIRDLSPFLVWTDAQDVVRCTHFLGDGTSTLEGEDFDICPEVGERILAGLGIQLYPGEGPVKIGVTLTPREHFAGQEGSAAIRPPNC